MNRFLYTILLYLLTPFIFLYLGYRAIRSTDYRGRVAERFGFKKLAITKPTILVHSVSMGETLAAQPLINRLLLQYPDHQILVTTSTPTGSQVVTSKFKQALHCYLPIDLPGAVRRFLDQINPVACIIMETELWPNLIHQLHKRQVPILLANARMSQKSAAGYAKMAAPLMQEMLSKIAQVSAQFDSDGQRFLALGLPDGNLQISGSIKFDLSLEQNLAQQQKQLRQQWAANRPVWVAGSTHPIEHQQLLKTHQQLLTQFPNLLLILVPRHPERFDEVVEQCQQQGFNVIRRSEQTPPSPQCQVVVGDTMGELLLFFGLADISYVGGSLIERGGHNPLEPAALGKPVIMGRSVYNFSDICQHLVAADAMVQVDDSQALTTTISALLTDENHRVMMGNNGKTLVENNRGTVGRLMSWVNQQID